MPPTTQGCCGLMIQVSFVSHKTEKPHLLIKKFTLPVTSKHVIITPQERASTATEPIKHESQLSEEQTILLKALGTARLPAYSIKSVMKTVHPKLNMGNNLIWRVRKKGLSEKFGGDEDTSLVIFMHHGQKWNDNGGKFQVKTTGCQVHSWCGQMPLEAKLNEVFGRHVSFIDTTHDGCKYMLKTGPSATVCCFGLTAPIGIMQIPEEDGQSIDECFEILQFNEPERLIRSDGGSGWPYPCEERRSQHRTEDPNHFHRNYLQASGKAPNPEEFMRDMGKALYGYTMDIDGLEKHLLELLEKYSKTGVSGLVKSLHKHRVKRCFAYTCMHLILAEKGGAARCEQVMNVYKGRGTLRNQIKKWSLSEVLIKHQEDVLVYEQKILDMCKKHIKNQLGFLSKYVLDRENNETKHMIAYDLLIDSVEKGVKNPCHNYSRYQINSDVDVGNNILGTHYKISRRDKKYDPIDVFIPDDETILVISNFYVHLSFWIRDRYIQRAMQDYNNSNRKMNNLNTLHARWDIRTHPLYEVAYTRLKSSMQIDVEGLGDEYLPYFLRGSAMPSSTSNIIAPRNDEGNKPMPLQGKRYSDIRALTGSIEHHGERDTACYSYLMKPLQVLRNACLQIVDRSNKGMTRKIKAVLNKLNSDGVILPTVPQAAVNCNTVSERDDNHKPRGKRKVDEKENNNNDDWKKAKKGGD